MHLPAVLLVVAALLVIVSLIEPLAARLRIASSVLLAVTGVAIGAGSTAILAFDVSGTLGQAAHLITDFPVDSQTFIYGFLPILLFQASMNIAVREMMDDWAPIFFLAVVAVIFTSLVIGFALHPFAPVSLAACLLLGAIVATTDPIAVIGIFRDIGAPARLSRLVDGESLLNDAAAITLFILFAGLVTDPQPVSVIGLVGDFFVTLIGGTLVGIVVARAAMFLLPVLRRNPAGQISVCVALPYLAFVAAEHGAGVSGVVAVVAAGITLNLGGPSRMAPSAWAEMRGIWNQLDYWAASLLFILASILMPRLLQGLGVNDAVLLLLLIVAATGARFVMLFGVLPLLSAIGMSQRVGSSYRWVILWGGLRGASTIALALSITESNDMPADVQRFIAVLSTGFVLFTLLVQGTTMKPLMRRLGLNRLSAVDSALRAGILSRVDREARAAVSTAADTYGIAQTVDPLPAIAVEVPPQQISGPQKISLALVAIARRERDFVLRHFDERTVSAAHVGRMLAMAGKLIEGARLGGEQGYRTADRASLKFPVTVRAMLFANRYFGISRPLARALSDRFEILLVRGAIIEELAAYAQAKLVEIFDGDTVQRISDVLDERLAANRRELDALRLQYPAYAENLDRRFLERIGLRHRERHYQSIVEEGLIGPAVHRDLQGQVDAQRETAEERPVLDLELDAPDLVARLPLLSGLDEGERRDLARLLKPRFALPGDCLIRKGTRGEAAFFIASGAVEVSAPKGRMLLGRGAFFGELALLTDERRSADVHAVGYCSLLVLGRADFRTFLDAHPSVAEEIGRVAAGRLAENRGSIDAGIVPA